MTRWFEDVEIDTPFPIGSHSFTEDEIVRFARIYDPQYFHIDPEAARGSHFGGLIASGWHTAAIGHRKMVDALADEAERARARGERPGVSGPSPGINVMSFPAPVRPGDTLDYTLTVTSKRPSKSLPGWGVLLNRIEARNQRGENVYSAEVVGFVRLRDFSPPLGRRIALALARLPGLKRLIGRGT